MLDLYAAIVFITVFALFITAADVLSNHLLSKKNKAEIVVLCLLIGVAIFCEWVGVKTNGAAVSLIGLHKVAKLIEFCIAPSLGYAAAVAYGEAECPKIAGGILLAHAAFEVLALFNGWVFSVDAENVYHREGLYWIYIAVFFLSTIYCFICIWQGNKKYRAGFGGVLALILCFLATGIGVQMVYSDIRIDFMCVAIGNLFLYNYRGNVVHQVDALTQLLGRRCYEKRIETLKSPAYILVFDVNKFKEINDTCGHAAGDECLRLIAQKIYGIYGKSGRCYRIGGDEFCVILHKNFDKLQALNRRFAESVERLQDSHPEITGVALGYAYYDEEKTTVQAVIDEADKMMYQNKH